MDRDRLLDLVVALGCEFSRRGMLEQCRRLRIYYVALKQGLDTARHRIEIHWDEELVVEWMRVLRLEPFHRDYPVQSSTRCQRCTYRPGSVVTKRTFPEGAKLECLECGNQWLVIQARGTD